MEKTEIKSLNLEELTAFVESLGEKKFRAKQIYEWMHRKHVASFSEMTNISAALIEKLNQNCTLTSLKKADVQISKIDGTRKYLFLLDDGNVIESVLMRYKHGNSVCISSQVGCRMGCRFCASTLDGLERNLRPSEMLDQIYQIQRDTGERVSNVVVMGSGEPLDNYDNLIRFIHLLTEEGGLHISQRNVTVSTCGLVPKIRELADQGLTITLALSLHAPNDEVRKSLMPIARTYALKDVLAACHYYFEKTGRRMTFEYSLVQGVNDNLDEARELAGLKYADKYGYQYAVQLDGDGQHRPEYLESMIKKMEEGYDIVIGSRFVGEKKPFTMRMLGSNLIEMAIRFTNGVNIKDPTSGMRMFSKRMIREFASGLNYGPEPDTVSYLIRQGARVAEVPVIMDERILGVSYLTPVNAMRYMLKMLISILLIQNFRKRR